MKTVTNQLSNNVFHTSPCKNRYFVQAENSNIFTRQWHPRTMIRCLHDEDKMDIGQRILSLPGYH